ncbi:MAG TPA: NAD-dependent epimerase/dehydratase family protein [Candidatus Kapabacteria bacterium]|nr:NAD-dependent epimerase/dehydratase family protein [Candidatus Kapabacteria bacterium]
MSVLQGKNILVTGATGLVGSHLVEKLLMLQPFRIVALSRSRDSQAYFFQKGLDNKVVIANGDLKDKERIIDIVTKYEINYIFHIAAQPIVATAYINPYETLATNIMGTIHILEAARLSPYIKGVIVASSDKAYGKDCTSALEDQALRGDHPYDVSKSCTDLLALTYAKTYNLPVTVSRFGNIFGPGDLNFNRIIPGIFKAAIKNEVLPLRSDGTFVRDYVYVKDVVEGYIALAEQMDKARGQAFNFSTGYNFSVIQLIEKLSWIIGTRVNYSIVNNQKNEIPEQSLNYTKAETVLGCKATTTFEQAILETYGWYRRMLDADRLWVTMEQKLT